MVKVSFIQMLPVPGKLKSTHAEDIIIMIGSSWFVFWPHERGRLPAFVDLLPAVVRVWKMVLILCRPWIDAL